MHRLCVVQPTMRVAVGLDMVDLLVVVVLHHIAFHKTIAHTTSPVPPPELLKK
jgi:hypothetical protein